MYKSGFIFLGLCTILNLHTAYTVDYKEIKEKYSSSKEICDKYFRAQAMLNEAIETQLKSNGNKENIIRSDALLQDAIRLYKEISKVVSQDQRVKFRTAITDHAYALVRGDGVAKNLEKAADLLIESASLGDEWAKYLLKIVLSNLYEGNGIARDLEKAIELIRKAASLYLDKTDEIEIVIFTSYLTEYAYALATGDGVAKNTEKSIEILRESASLGHEVAQRALFFFLNDHASDAIKLLREYVRLEAESKQQAKAQIGEWNKQSKSAKLR